MLSPFATRTPALSVALTEGPNLPPVNVRVALPQAVDEVPK